MAETIEAEVKVGISGNGIAKDHGPYPPAVLEWNVQPIIDYQQFPTTPRILGVADLYAETPGRSALLLRATELLALSVRRLQEARERLDDEDQIGADYEVTLFQGDLPELFYLSSLSEGFGAVIVALYHGLKNRRAARLTPEQLLVVQRCAARLGRQLFLNYEAALDLIDELETVGLKIDPPEAEGLTEILVDAGDG